MNRLVEIYRREKWSNKLGFILAGCTFLGRIFYGIATEKEISIWWVLIYFLYAALVFAFSKIVVLTVLWQKDLKIDKTGQQARRFIMAFLINFFVGIPILIAFYPGMIEPDAYFQIRGFLGESVWNAQQPIISTLIYGKLITFERHFFGGGSDNTAVFLFCICQMMFQCLVFAYAYSVIGRILRNRKTDIFLLLLYPLISVYRMFGYTVVKDTVYALSVLLLFTVVTDILTLNRGGGWRICLLRCRPLVRFGSGKME